MSVCKPLLDAFLVICNASLNQNKWVCHDRKAYRTLEMLGVHFVDHLDLFDGARRVGATFIYARSFLTCIRWIQVKGFVIMCKYLKYR